MQRGSVIEIAVGALVVLGGAVAWIGRNAHRVGWVVSALGAGLFAVGWNGGTLFGIAIEPRTITLLIVGAIVILAGGVVRAALLTRRRIRQAMARPSEDTPTLLDDDSHAAS
jgi:hypothetical protein